METWQILLLIVLAIIAGYLIGLFIVLGYGLHTRYKLRHRLEAMNIILYEKREIIMKLYRYSLEHGALYSETDTQKIQELESLSFEKPVFDITKNAISLQKSIQTRFSYGISSNVIYQESKDIQNALIMIADMDRTLRTSCSLYNADILGFNYWVNVPGYKWIFCLFNMKTRDPIN